jgi:hypothetical protein
MEQIALLYSLHLEQRCPGGSYAKDIMIHHNDNHDRKPPQICACSTPLSSFGQNHFFLCFLMYFECKCMRLYSHTHRRKHTSSALKWKLRLKRTHGKANEVRLHNYESLSAFGSRFPRLGSKGALQ